jgi:hypothetical protein
MFSHSLTIQLHDGDRAPILEARRYDSSYSRQARETSGAFGDLFLLTGRIDVLVRVDQRTGCTLGKPAVGNGITRYSHIRSFRQPVSLLLLHLAIS